ncbi:hypothetical protein ACH5RR_029071 [Cinchona calisaya]|uniref:Uncharacterized protein n=1 Tax=Cinchona calisaya TaxID=153742 RepID=A0ABD2YU72_9GENT
MRKIKLMPEDKLMVLLLLRHAMTIPYGDRDDDPSTLFSLKKDARDNDPNGNNSTSASRGNWWQVPFLIIFKTSILASLLFAEGEASTGYRYMAKCIFFFGVDEFLFVPKKSVLKTVMDSLSEYTQFTIE